MPDDPASTTSNDDAEPRSRLTKALFVFFDEQGITREKLAEIGDVTEAAISQYRSQSRLPSVPVFEKLAAFATSLGWTGALAITKPIDNAGTIYRQGIPAVTKRAFALERKRMEIVATVDQETDLVELEVVTPAQEYGTFDLSGVYQTNQSSNDLPVSLQFGTNSTQTAVLRDVWTIVEPVALPRPVRRLGIERIHKLALAAFAHGDVRITFDGYLPGNHWTTPIQPTIVSLGMPHPDVLHAEEVASKGRSLLQFNSARQQCPTTPGGPKIEQPPAPELALPRATSARMTFDLPHFGPTKPQGIGKLHFHVTLVALVEVFTNLGALGATEPPDTAPAHQAINKALGKFGFGVPSIIASEPSSRAPDDSHPGSAECDYHNGMVDLKPLSLGINPDHWDPDESTMGYLGNISTATTVHGRIHKVVTFLKGMPDQPEDRYLRVYFARLAEFLSGAIVVNSAPFPTLIPVLNTDLRIDGGEVQGHVDPAPVEIYIPEASNLRCNFQPVPFIPDQPTPKKLIEGVVSLGLERRQPRPQTT